jgi:hypothetical protein
VVVVLVDWVMVVAGVPDIKKYPAAPATTITTTIGSMILTAFIFRPAEFLSKQFSRRIYITYPQTAPILASHGPGRAIE